MEQDPDNLETLRRLLALKRHEVPPPGFFDSFPDRVRARLRAGPEVPASSWWNRWRLAWPLRPALAGACTLAACGWMVWKVMLVPTPLPGGSNLAVKPAIPGAGTSAPGQPFLVGGTGETLSFPESSSTTPVASGAPPGLFSPGAGMRNGMQPASIWTFPRTGVHTAAQERLLPRSLTSTNPPSGTP